jgi:hypothetical protein
MKPSGPSLARSGRRLHCGLGRLKEEQIEQRKQYDAGLF